jgi:hypothetical protein
VGNGDGLDPIDEGLNAAIVRPLPIDLIACLTLGKFIIRQASVVRNLIGDVGFGNRPELTNVSSTGLKDGWR